MVIVDEEGLSNAQLRELLNYAISKLKEQQHQVEYDGIDVMRSLGSSIVSLDSGDTAFMLICTALVFFMTLPGLVLYYAGMTRVRHVLNTSLLVFAIFCVITLTWFSVGYSLALAPITPFRGSSTPIYGDGSRLWLRGIKRDSVHSNAPTIPESIYCAFQLAFAVITPALACGSFADRVKFWPTLLFVVLWHVTVYCPIAHAVWHPDGFLYQAGVLDFAGGNVVHITAGCAGIVAGFVVGNKDGFAKERFEAHNTLLTFMGVCMLFIGWFGFNSGSALHSNGLASLAFLNTIIGPAASSITWMLVDSLDPSRPRFLGMINGLIAGLVAITPAAGYVDANGAFWIGAISGPLCNLSARLKVRFFFDDALDAFGLHAIGGIIGCILTGFFATSGADGKNGIFYENRAGEQLGIQLYGIVVCGGWSLFATLVLALSIDLVFGLRTHAGDAYNLSATMDRKQRGSECEDQETSPKHSSHADEVQMGSIASDAVKDVSVEEDTLFGEIVRA